MKRVGLKILSVGLLGALAACGADSKPSQATTPVAPEPVEQPVVETPPTPEAKPAEAPAPTYLPGKWVWFELTTSDVAKATTFYSQVFGWTVADKDMQGQKVATIMNGDKELGMLQALPADAKKQKMSPSWIGYVSVSDVDAAVSTATAAGGKVVVAAMDMPEVGRFAVLSDATGAGFGVVKAVKGDQPDAAPVTGNVVWMEHWAKDATQQAAAAALYGALAGYQNQTMKMGKDDHTVAIGSGAPRMGFAKAPKASFAGRFAPYVAVADVDATVKAATKLKAKVVVKAMDVPNVGRIAVLADPQGAVFAVMTPAVMAGANPAQTGAAPAGTSGVAPADAAGKPDAAAPAPAKK